MASPTSNPFYSSAGGGIPANGGQQRLALDNLIRRELRVSDPGDPDQIAKALLERFQADPRAAAIAQEARGLPFLQASPLPMAAPGNGGSTAAELKQAMADVEHDLGELLSHSTLKDARPQLEGWALAIRNAAGQGVTAARFALDPGQRDKAFAARRTLGGYARLSRLVGTFAPEARSTCRSLAQSVDEVAAIIIVSMGEALATSGYTGIGDLISVSYSDLQVRRDAVIFALRNLVGSTQLAYGQNEWPRGLDGYREVHRILGEQGLGDLRTLLNENELALVMDELIRRTAESGADGLRILSGSAEMELERFRRLVAAVEGQSQRSPALTAFLEALLLFLNAFEHGTGARLLQIGRPPLLYYGLYGMSKQTHAEEVLQNLIKYRGILAHEADCFMLCKCDANSPTCQVFLDKVVYDLDRAVDYYAVGARNDTPPEKLNDSHDPVHPNMDVPTYLATLRRGSMAELRAVAYGYLIVRVQQSQKYGLCALRSTSIDNSLTNIMSLLKSFLPHASVSATQSKPFPYLNTPHGLVPQPGSAEENQMAIQSFMTQELGQQRGTEERLRELVTAIVPGCISVEATFRAVDDVMNLAIEDIQRDAGAAFGELNMLMPQHPDISLENIDTKIP